VDTDGKLTISPIVTPNFSFMNSKRILFLKPPDRFLENEFVYQQLGPHYLQSYLDTHGISSDLAVFYETEIARAERCGSPERPLLLEDLKVLLMRDDGTSTDRPFDEKTLLDYQIIAMSVMTPQAPDAYLINKKVKQLDPKITTVIGGSHPRYYQEQVLNLPSDISFDFVVPQDGWQPMLDIAVGNVRKSDNPQVLVHNMTRLISLPPPTRPIQLMERYQFDIGGAPAFHTITALGCPFTCHFCESGIESVRTFPQEMVDQDLATMAEAHATLENSASAVMFFDDVGLMSPKQVGRLSALVAKHKFTTWRAFTHAYLVTRHKENLLAPFRDTGGKRIGIGIETGSQRSLDLINKRNGKPQSVQDHFDAITIANDLGIAVDAFTMVYPWEDENDLADTTKLVEFVARSKVNGIDTQGRPLKNHVDSTIMSPFQGTKFYELITLGAMPGVKLDPTMDPGLMYYKGDGGGSGWPYLETRLPRERYVHEQEYRNSLRPKYR